MNNYTDYNDNKKITYHEQTDIQNILKLRAILKTLPDFCKDYFRAMDPLTTTKTRISYAYDIRIFFQFLLDENPAFKNHSMKDFTVDVLDQLKAVDIEEYQEYLKVYKNGDKTETNGERGLKRKISALRSFYAYYYKHEFIQTNPTVLIDVPKTHEKSIIRLDADEVAMLLDYIEHCDDELTSQKRVYYEKTKERDLAIVTLLLGTGIRVSECVGLDIEDVDFKNNGIKAVENLVKKYSRAITTTKKITPHKLRSTYGTALYQETGDIYLVADVLGHRDVNTTKKHYAAMDDARRRKAATAVHLRED